MSDNKKEHNVFESAQCMECFDAITEHSNQVFKAFEVKSETAIHNFIGQTTEMFQHLREESNSYFEARERKADEFYDKQEIRYDKLETKLTGMVKWTLGIVLFIVAIYGGVVAASYVEVTKKANKNEVLSLTDAKNLIDLGDKYRDQRYVLRSGETIDKYNYMWLVETIFDRATRSAKEDKK